MTYSVGNSEVANYANTSSGQVTNVAADNGLGGAGVVTDVTDRVALSFVVDTNIQFLTVDVTSLDDYVAGITDVTITVNPNVYVYGTQTNQFNITAPTGLSALDASMQIIGGAVGDTIKLVNNGNIVGFGGDGSGTYQFQTGCCCCTYFASINNPSPGNAALSFITPGITLSIENNGYIAGGGGGGGSPSGSTISGFTPGGGGGAGGGISGPVGSVPGGDSGGNLTVRAVPPNAGNNGITSAAPNTVIAIQGGGGGFKLAPPDDTGGASAGTVVQGVGGGGGAGGGGAASSTVLRTFDNTGGSANNAAPTPTLFVNTVQGGGGGGWGAAGAAGYVNSALVQAGAAGGNSIVTNGNAYTLTGSGQLYGSVNTATTSVAYTFPTSSETGTTLDLASIPGYAVGTNVVLILPTSVRLTSNSIATPALNINKSGTSNSPSSVRLIINGAILGAGGRGGSESTTPSVGGNALVLQASLATTLIVENTIGYIAGGGGGGGRSTNTAVATVYSYGGGGAGLNGSSGVVGDAAYNAGVSSGVSAGTNGTVVSGGITYASGGSGGTILPGVPTPNTGTFTAGTYAGLGGQAGGSGAFNTTGTITTPGNRGGGFNTNGGSATGALQASGGGGGGWGGSGGAGRRGSTNIQAGQAPGVTIRNNSGSVIIFVTNPTNFAGIVSS